MATLQIRNIDTVISCDAEDRVFRHADIFCRDGIIEAITQHGDGGGIPGAAAPPTSGDTSKEAPRTGPCSGKAAADRTEAADEVIDGSGMLCYPGLVNAHHHLYQIFTRNLPEMQDLELFDWLRALYEIWKNLDAEDLYHAALAGMGELLKSGCTTCFDHHYVFPAGAGDLPGAEAAAAEKLGMRLHLSRGSMDLSKKDGGLPPDPVVQTVDEILRDSRGLIERFQDDSFGAMCRIALAPCSPFSVSADLLRESAKLARAYGVRLHTHLCETKDEERYTLERFGMRPLAYMESLGWTGPDVWYAHGIHFNDEEIRLLAETGTGVCHCPVSNMKLSSGVARIPELLAAGVPVGLGVDGSASNDGSGLLEELRVSYLLQRLARSGEAPDGYRLLKAAACGGARLLGREREIGSLEEGKCADFFLIRKNRLETVGALRDPKSFLCTVGHRGVVDMTVVNGRVAVRGGHLEGIDEERAAEDAQTVWRRFLARAGGSRAPRRG